MSIRAISDNDAASQAAEIPAAAALPEAPLAMPVQSLEAGAIMALLRGFVGVAGRTVKH